MARNFVNLCSDAWPDTKMSTMPTGSDAIRRCVSLSADCDDDRPRPKNGDCTMHHRDGRSVSECQEKRARTASLSALGRTWALAATGMASPASKNPRKALSSPYIQGHLENVGWTDTQSWKAITAAESSSRALVYVAVDGRSLPTGLRNTHRKASRCATDRRSYEPFNDGSEFGPMLL